jgi:hypothetical protein
MIHRILRRSSFAMLAAGAFALAGCGGGPKLAPVSGIVTFDGKPYPNAVVMFQPVASKGTDSPGRGSSGITDKDGRFVLKYDGQENGAVVGKCSVRIVTNGVFGTGDSDKSNEGTGSDDYTAPKSVKADPIPSEWFDGTNPKYFEVPAGGTDKANFDIVSKKKK